MRMDLNSNAHRNPVLKLILAGFRWYMGEVPGPQLYVTWNLSLFHTKMPIYMFRGVGSSGSWSKGEAELFATFVSDLNTCHF